MLVSCGLVSCNKDIDPVQVGNEGVEKGEMVYFSVGNTSSTETVTKAMTYYMPDSYRFVCRMYYKSATGSDLYDVTGGTDVTSWLKVDGPVGNALYWRGTFPELDPTDSGLFDSAGNDYEAKCFYWQNRKEHAFLAWTDLNHATELTYSPIRGSQSLKFKPYDLDYQLHTGQEAEQWNISGYQVYGAPAEFSSWSSLRKYIEAGSNYENNIKNRVPDGIDPADFASAQYYYAYGWSCKYSLLKAERTIVDDAHQTYGWVQYNMYYDKLPYTGSIDGLERLYDSEGIPSFLYDRSVNAYRAEIGIRYLKTDSEGKALEPEQIYTPSETAFVERTMLPPALDQVEDGDFIIDGDTCVAVVDFTYYETDNYGNTRYDETNPRYTFYYKELLSLKKQEIIKTLPANVFDLTRGDKTSIKDQPDICQALTIQAPLGATQSSNRVNLYFKHQFSQVQVNIKASSDLSVEVDPENIRKVELLGVSEKGYVFTEIDENGEVQPTTYEPVLASSYTVDQLKENQFGTSFEMFDMGEENRATGYLKSFNALAFGQLQAIRVSWEEKETGVMHVATYRVPEDNLRNLKSANKYIWNIEIRRGTLAIIRTEIADWTVLNSALEYNTDGTIVN